MKIVDFRVFLTQLIGSLSDGNIVKYDQVIQFYRGLIVTKVKTYISNIVINNKISVLEISPMLEEISEQLKNNLVYEFDRYGISILNFYITSINFPDEDFKLINSILEDKAAFDIMGDNRYSVLRTFDVMETAAGNENNGLATAGLSLGMGVGAGYSLGNVFNDNMNHAISLNHINCPNCKASNQAGNRFCFSCGSKMEIEKECPSCHSSINENMKFCGQCGFSLENSKCSNCQAELKSDDKFCGQCGTRTGGI